MTEPQAPEALSRISEEARESLRNTTERTQIEFHEDMARNRRVYEASLKNPKEELAALVLQQKNPNVMSKYEQFLDIGYEAGIGYVATRQEYINAFKESQLYREIDQKIDTLHNQGKTINNGELAGFVFEALSYGIVAAHESQKGNIVLSPEQTFAFCRDMIYPDAIEIPHDFGNELKLFDKEGVYVPDGLIIDANGKVVGLLEYKLSATSISRQVRRSKKLVDRFRSKGLGGLSESIQFVFVTPNMRVPQSTRGLVDHRPLKGKNEEGGLISTQFKNMIMPPFITKRTDSSRQRMQEPQN